LAFKAGGLHFTHVTAAETESTCRILDELDLCRDVERIPLIEFVLDEKTPEIPPKDGLYTI
jgi:hypothetical protein